MQLNEGSLLQLETFHQKDENELYCQVCVSHRDHAYLFLLNVNEVTGLVNVLEKVEDSMLDFNLEKIGV
jgi:hypothetical protein